MGGVSYRKAMRRLKERQKAFDAHGQNPPGIQNPGKQSNGGMKMHRPGSMQG